MKIVYFGDEYSHTYAAALKIIEETGLKGCQTVGCETVFGALERVKRGDAELCVVPIENSFEGTVVATVDALAEFELQIGYELTMPIRQNLIAKRGVSLDDIKRVYSHPQALAQCGGNLKRLLPDAVAESVAYTSAGLELLNDESAAIARAPKKGQVVLAESIEDSNENSTRFVAVRADAQKERGNKASVQFSTENKPGALLKVLAELNARGLNMTKIESRPAKKKMGQYVFFVDFMFYGSGSELDSLIKTLAAQAEDMRFLGRYFKCGE